MYNLEIGNKFKLKDFDILSKNSTKKHSSYKRYNYLEHISILKSAVPDGNITIQKETKDKIFIKEISAIYPGRLFIYEWMIKEYIK